MKIFLLLFFSIITFAACTNKYENLLKSNTAEVREFLMEGESDGVSATLICGMREQEYKINGYATNLIEFGVLTFDLNNSDEFDENLANFVLFVDTSRYDGTLEKNPFNDTLVADIKKVINKSSIVTAKIMIGDFVREIKLKLIGSDWEVDIDDVYKIVASKFKEQLNYLNSSNVFGGEVYIKILNDADIYKGDYYWYVSIFSRKGGMLSMIISPYSREILAINNTLKKVA